ncbi:helix-turn-helix domain-containing protein [Stutzerimonas kunmingensis]|uniref:helix-turn-helix domain-containing protein n=1 Tax=Stutzerimonas kunmingensis TaxID=1211807 RepID=UPI0028A19296|nr:helix-turn-helix domain-containing protein [Stutzerimonas kunmingensis]
MKTIRSEEQATRSGDQHITAPILLASVLKHLLYDGSLNKFEAARKLGDWSLHRTISNLANDYGVPIKRTPEKRPHVRQPVARYSITDSARNHAGHVLAKLSRRKKTAA